MVVRGLHTGPKSSLRVDAWMRADPTWHGCPSSALVKVVFSGTPAFWRANASKLHGEARFAIAINSGATILDITVGYVDDPRIPLLPEFAGPTPTSPLAPAGPMVLDRPTSSQTVDGASWVITGTLHDWGHSWAPIAVNYTADVISPRTLGSCYVRLPNLTGGRFGSGASAIGTAIAPLFDEHDVTHADTAAAREILPSTAPLSEVAQQALYIRRDREAARTVPATSGRLLLDSRGDVLASDSAPSPAAASGARAMWACAPSDTDVNLRAGGSASDITLPAGGLKSPSGKVVAFPPSHVRVQDLGCEGTAVLTSPKLALLEAAALVLVGILAAWTIDSARKGVGRWWADRPGTWV
jgi:hypothetical protein